MKAVAGEGINGKYTLKAELVFDIASSVETKPETLRFGK
jgi:hypothetical protein